MTKRGVISVRGLSCFGSHGVLRHEQLIPQEFLINLEFELDLDSAIELDDVDATVDYSRACKVAVGVVEGNSFSLIEVLAHTVGTTLLTEFPVVDRIDVTVQKVAPPMQFHVASVGVSLGIEREN